YELTGSGDPVQVLARQAIDLERPHPFTEAGEREFNCLLWMPPNEQRAGDIVLVDSTNFTTLFGGTKSLETFWRNLAAMGELRLVAAMRLKLVRALYAQEKQSLLN